MVPTEAFIQRARERVVNNEFEKIELSKADQALQPYSFCCS